jgi:hypothetical protein
MDYYIFQMNLEIALEQFNANNQDIISEPMSDKELESYIMSL